MTSIECSRQVSKLMKLLEKWYPYIVASGCAFVYIVWSRWMPDAQKVPAILSAVISVSAISVGFLGAIKAVILSLSSSRAIQNIKKAGYYEILVSYLSEAVTWSFIVAWISVLFLFIDLKPGNTVHECACTAWVFLVIASLLSCFRITRIFVKLMHTDISPN